MMEFWNTILFELGGKPVLLIDLLSAVFGLTTVFLAGRNSRYNFYVGYMYTALLFFMFWQKNLYANLLRQPISLGISYTKKQTFGKLYSPCDGWRLHHRGGCPPAGAAGHHRA